MDPLWITIAFALGFAVRQVGLPPLVGFLAAGFVLNLLGAQGGPLLQMVSELGVTLLLFCVGLKLDLRSLTRSEVWAGAGLHMGLSVVVFAAGLLGLAAAGVPPFVELGWSPALLIAFALSFSSTVFAVKVLEERAETAAFHGRVAIGILIMQDILAVIFLAASAGKIPSPLALIFLPLLFVLRPLLTYLMDRSGHGELMILLGLFLALVAGAAGFEWVGLKADLGALVLGVMVAHHPKASELAKHLMGFKDLFLVGFFLSIGLSGVPTLGNLGVACLLAACVPFKVMLFFVLLTRFRLRARTAVMASLSLANYSEFGLIVGALAVGYGWIDNAWLVTLAVALALTFLLAAPLNTHADRIYARWAAKLKRFETPTRHPTDAPIDPGGAAIAVFGMGRVGTRAYDTMVENHGPVVIAMDHDHAIVKQHQAQGRNVLFGDPTDPDFWARAQPSRRGLLKLVLLAMPQLAANRAAARQLRAKGFKGVIAAAALYDDELAELQAAGVDAAFNLYNEAGRGLADHAQEALEERLRPTIDPA
jgi:glutathione-regulated potassium-efflux system ancillary protein KefC